MKVLRIAEDTQLAYSMPMKIYGARLVHSAATTADIYDELKSGELTAGKKKIALAVTTSMLSDDAKIPEQGITFYEGIYVDWNAGEVFLTVDSSK